jgi:outer membrane protein assembly factor BamB
VLWSVPTGAPYVSSLLYYEGLVYMASDAGVVTAVDATTGERVWQERVDGIFTASPVAGDGKVYLLSETGNAYVLRAGRHPQVLERNALGERMVASPAVSDGRLYIRTDEHLLAIGKGR